MDKEIRQELESRIESKIVGTSMMNILHMALSSKSGGDEADAEERGRNIAHELEKSAKKDAKDIVDLVLATLEAKVPA